MENINVGHLLQLQRDLTATIREEMSAAKGELRADIAATRSDLRGELEKVKEQQIIANGRTGKLERLTAALRRRTDARATLWSELSKTQKAKLTAAVALLGPITFEVVQRLIPVLIALLPVHPAHVPGTPITVAPPAAPPAEVRPLKP